jgi:hypothetical protein
MFQDALRTDLSRFVVAPLLSNVTVISGLSGERPKRRHARRRSHEAMVTLPRHAGVAVETLSVVGTISFAEVSSLAHCRLPSAIRTRPGAMQFTVLGGTGRE